LRIATRVARKQSETAKGASNSEGGLREQQMLESAARLFKERGYRGATLQDVADEIGLTRTAIYHYFPSKEQLLYRILEEALKDAVARFEEIASSDDPPDRKMHRMVREYVSLVIRHTPSWWVLLSEGEHNLPPRQYRRLHRLVRQQDSIQQKIFQEGIESGKFSRLNPKIAVFAIAGMCNWLARWYDPSGEVDPNTLADILMHILEHGYLEPENQPCLTDAMEYLRAGA